jgi:voltage-gated potassium channel
MRDLIAGSLPPQLQIPLVLGGLMLLALLLLRLLGRPWLYRTIFEAETAAGRRFDLVLMLAIVTSVLAVILESDPLLQQRWAGVFTAAEWSFTLLFTLEYLLRLLCVEQPLSYAGSFFGLVDLLAIAPSFLGLVIPGVYVFIVVRVLRLLRIFRVLRMGDYLQASDLLWNAVLGGRRKIAVFLLAMVILVVIIGALMYVIEGPINSGFRSMPVGIYWAVVTITTVGYGDVAPLTPLGRFLASAVMLLGYSIIAVPTGILTAEFGAAVQRQQAGLPERHRPCLGCGHEDHDNDARHCKLCGVEL